MNIRETQELVNKFNEQKQNYEEAKGLPDQTRAALAISELTKLAAELFHRPLSGDPSVIAKDVDKFSIENQLRRQGIDPDDPAFAEPVSYFVCKGHEMIPKGKQHHDRDHDHDEEDQSQGTQALS